MNIQDMYGVLYTALLILLGISILTALIRAITGKRIVDKIIGINMIGTLTMISIAVLSALFGESWLIDVCLIYVLMSFIAVVTLCKIYISLYRQRRKEAEDDE